MLNYDKQRLKEDADYRKKVLDNIAGQTRQKWFRARLKAMALALVGIVLFTIGFFTGGLLDYTVVWGVTLFIVCLLIIPMMGWMLVDVHKHRKRQEQTDKSSQELEEMAGEKANE